MSTTDDNKPKCAACGKGGDDLKTCNGCKLVKYCDATCQKAHHPMHKKECKKRAAELRDEALFKEPPPRGECPICMLPLPPYNEALTYKSCCGKELCKGCSHAANAVDDRMLCPYCRTPAPESDGEYIERLKKRVAAGDAAAMRNLGCFYRDGEYGLRRNTAKAMKLFLRAGELGYAEAHYNIGYAYYQGPGVERNMKKSLYYFELAAMGGDVFARHNLGCLEVEAGNVDRAMKHFLISAGAGDDESLKVIRQAFFDGDDVTKEDFEKALRAHQASKDEMKSEQREAAARFYGLN